MTGYQYETVEWVFEAAAPSGSEVSVDLTAEIDLDGQKKVLHGFYCGSGTYRFRFLPEQIGSFVYRISGVVSEEGILEIKPARKGQHGLVRAEGIHLSYEDGTPFYAFGTTVYALAHQSEALMDETIETLRKAPFNKIRMCMFPKDYKYNHNEPLFYAFEKDSDGNWDPSHPCFAFWDAFEKRLFQLFDAGIQVDLILFHPYDRWGFASMSQENNLIYLEYLLRRFAALPGLWWSMSNEYDLVFHRTMEEWYQLEEYVAEKDVYHHLLSSHNCFKPYDFERENITHISWQTKQFSRISEMMKRYGKPVLVDECCYEGNLPDNWGAITGKEMTARFWRTTVQGAFCTHGETFVPGEDEVVWWARGGKLIGESVERIRFLRSVMESLPGPLSPILDPMSELFGLSKEEQEKKLEGMPEFHRNFMKAVLRMEPIEAARFFAAEIHYAGHCGEEAFLHYYDIQSFSEISLQLPEKRKYRVEVLDTWNMTRKEVLSGVNGQVVVELPGREYMAVLATAIT